MTRVRGAVAERKVAFAFGVFFVIVMLVIAVWIPRPTETQWFVFRVVLALAAGGIGALCPASLIFRQAHMLAPGVP